MSADDSLPNDVDTLKSMLIAERAARMPAEGEAQYRALLIEKRKDTIKKLRHEQFGQSSERGGLLDQLELQLSDLEEDAAEAAAAAERITVSSFERRNLMPLVDVIQVHVLSMSNGTHCAVNDTTKHQENSS